MAFDKNVWTGRFAQPDDDADFPLKGSFPAGDKGRAALTGSYQPDGTAIPVPLERAPD